MSTPTSPPPGPSAPPSPPPSPPAPPRRLESRRTDERDHYRGLLRQLDEIDVARAFMDRQKYFLVVVPDTGEPYVSQFDDAAKMADAMRALQGKQVFCYPFHGERLTVTKPPYRHLVTGDGPPIPLYCPPQDQLEPDETGDMAVTDKAVPVPAPVGGRPGIDA